jgi:HK97 gp10 family phage protein
MGHYSIDRAAVASIASLPSVDRQVHQLADAILTEAQGRAPVDTGALRASGFVEGRASAYTVGFEKEYAPYVEFGTSEMNAQPFLTPSALRDRGAL